MIRGELVDRQGDVGEGYAVGPWQANRGAASRGCARFRFGVAYMPEHDAYVRASFLPEWAHSFR